MKEVIAKYKNIFPGHIWILLAIVLVGIFLRTYRLHDWLYFYPDQARDVMIVDGVIDGKTGLPLLGFKAASTNFQLGAMYSYFQIIAAKIFGSSPDAVAYPDVFFGILSIPLLYYFLRRYFSINISLAMAGLYSVSFFAIRYSRFAWNTNPIPFFAILFLLSMHEILFGKSKTSWWWVVALGASLGVGVQLHTVLLVSLPVASLMAFAYTTRLDKRTWKKWTIIFLLALVLNTGQIVSELKTNFLNTRYFFNVLNERSPEEGSGFRNNFISNVVCQSQANVLYLSSLENRDNCDRPVDFKFDKVAKKNQPLYFSRLSSLTLGLVVFFAGYLLLAYRAVKEGDEKRRLFLFMNLTYGALIFLVIFPIITHNGQVRYWLPIIFLPFLFLGLFMEVLFEKFPRNYFLFAIGVAVLVSLVGLNVKTIIFEVKQHASHSRSNAQYVVLGELEAIESYIQEQSYPNRAAYIFGGQKYMQNFYKPLFYVASQKGFTTIRGNAHGLGDVPAGSSVFFIAQSADFKGDTMYDAVPLDLGFESVGYQKFGNVGVYKIKN